MNSSHDGAGDKPKPPGPAQKDATKSKMSDEKFMEGDMPRPADAWWDNQLKALYQSVLDEPLPDDMMKLVHNPVRKTGDAKAKGSRKTEGK
jgi:hypothetical protein